MRTTTTSARLKNNNTAAKKSILSGKGNGPRTSRLAAKINKTEDDIDFDEIEKKAKQEAEEAKKLGYKPTETVEPTVKKQPTSTSLSLKKENEEVKLTPAPIQETTQQFQKWGLV